MNVNLGGLNTLALADGHIHAMLLSVPSVVDGLHSTSEQVRKVVEELPYLQEDELVALGEKDNSCPICIVPFLALIAEEEMARAMDSPAHPVEELGVTRLVGEGRCGHVFCRKDLSKWIISGKNTCPLCRQPLFELEHSPSPAVVRGPGPAPLSPADTEGTNPAGNNAARMTAPVPSGGQPELQAMLVEHLARLQESFASALARGNGDAPEQANAPTADSNTDPASRSRASDTSTDAPQATDSRANPTARERGSGGIGRDLGEGHTDDLDEDEDDDVLAGLTATMSPQEVQNLRDLMSQARTMFSGSTLQDAMFGFGPNGQRPRDDRDDDRDQFSGMYS